MLSKGLSLRLHARFQGYNVHRRILGPIYRPSSYSRCIPSNSRLARCYTIDAGSSRDPTEDASYQDYLKHKIVGDLGLTDSQITVLDSRSLDELCRAKWGASFQRSPAAQMEQYRSSYLSYGYETWGWRIYRTTSYDAASNEKFQAFMTIFYDALGKAMKEHIGHDDHVRFMHFPIVQDRFWGGKHTTWLRNNYRSWLRDGGAVLSEPKMLREKGLGNMILSGPKYEYFIQVDEGSLESVLKYKEAGYVNVVKVDWPSDREHDHDGICDKGECEEVDGDEARVSYDVGFMQERLENLYPHLWHDLDTREWRNIYVRPWGNSAEVE